MTLVESMAGVALFGIVMATLISSTLGINRTYLEGESVAHLNLRAQVAMSRILELASQALTTDPQFTPLRPPTGIASHCLRFRLVQFVDSVDGSAVYDDLGVVYIYGSDGGTEPCRGLIIGRGPTLADIHAVGSGPDGVLGTEDDNTRASLAGGEPAVELLIPDRFAPRTGEMLTIDVSPAPIGRLLTFTLRVNVRERNGSLVLPNDIVLSERLALRR